MSKPKRVKIHPHEWLGRRTVMLHMREDWIGVLNLIVMLGSEITSERIGVIFEYEMGVDGYEPLLQEAQ